MGTIFYSDDGDYVHLNAGEHIYFIQVYTSPAYMRYGEVFATSADYIIAPDERRARANYLRRSSTRKEINGAKVTRVTIRDETRGLCQHCGRLGGH